MLLRTLAPTVVAKLKADTARKKERIIGGSYCYCYSYVALLLKAVAYGAARSRGEFHICREMRDSNGATIGAEAATSSSSSSSPPPPPPCIPSPCYLLSLFVSLSLSIYLSIDISIYIYLSIYLSIYLFSHTPAHTHALKQQQ